MLLAHDHGSAGRARLVSAAARHPNCRIGTVTIKSSGLRIIRLHSGPERTRRAIMAETRDLLDSMEFDGRPTVGFALVLWDVEGGSNAVCRAYPGSSIPSIAIPDFCRNRLLASKIAEWARE